MATTSLYPNGEKYDGIGNGDYTNIDDESDSAYNQWDDDDDNKRYESYIQDMPSDGYIITALSLSTQGASWSGGSSSSYATTTLFDASNNQICINDNQEYAYQSWTTRTSSSSTTKRTVTFVNGLWVRCQALGIGKGYKWRENWERVNVTYHTTTDGKPTKTNEVWIENSVFQTTWGKTVETSTNQWLYVERSVDGGAWTADCDEDLSTGETKTATYYGTATGETIRFRARLKYGDHYTDYTYSDTKTFSLDKVWGKQVIKANGAYIEKVYGK